MLCKLYLTKALVKTLLLTPWHTSFTTLCFLDKDVMASALAAILDYEDEGHTPRWQNTELEGAGAWRTSLTKAI